MSRQNESSRARLLIQSARDQIEVAAVKKDYDLRHQFAIRDLADALEALADQVEALVGGTGNACACEAPMDGATGDPRRRNECSCPYPEPAFDDCHRACPLHGDEAQLRAIALEYERALERIAGPRNSDPSTIRRTVAEATLRDHSERLHAILGVEP